MPTLVEELKRVENNQQKTKELEKAIKEFVIQPNTIDILKKAALNGLSAIINEGSTKLEPAFNQSGTICSGYLFTIDNPSFVKPLLTAHIIILPENNISIDIVDHDTIRITQKRALHELKTAIGLDEEEE